MPTKIFELESGEYQRFFIWWKADSQKHLREFEKERVVALIAEMQKSIKAAKKQMREIDRDGKDALDCLKSRIIFCKESIKELVKIQPGDILAHNAKRAYQIMPALLHPPYYKMWREQDK